MKKTMTNEPTSGAVSSSFFMDAFSAHEKTPEKNPPVLMKKFEDRAPNIEYDFPSGTEAVSSS